MSDLPQKHSVLGEGDQADAMMSVIVSAIIASRPPTTVVDGVTVYAAMSSRAVVLLLLSVVDVVMTGADMTDEEVARAASRLCLDRSPGAVAMVRSVLSSALAAASQIISADSGDTPRAETAAKA